MMFSLKSSLFLKPFFLSLLSVSSFCVAVAISNQNPIPISSFLSFFSISEFCLISWFGYMEISRIKSINPSQTRVGWIGIGVMGAAMASRVQSAGYTLTVFARTPEKAYFLQERGAHIVNSPADVARVSDVVFTMVSHPSDVGSVLLNDNGVVSNLSEGGVVVDHTSSHPELAKEISAVARSRGCWAIDAPVSGGDIGARDGKLAIFAGGDCNVVKQLTPLFEIMGKPTYVGESGCGQSCKIANQITVSANLVGLSEALVFAKQAELDLKQFVESIKEGAAGSMVVWGEND